MENDLQRSASDERALKQPIYLDYQATTPMAPEVFDAMVPWLKDNFANPHSAHRMGRQAAAAVEVAREQVAALMPSGGKVIFTGSATEAINMLRSVAHEQLLTRNRENLVYAASEHAAVYDTIHECSETSGSTDITLDVNQDGLIDKEHLRTVLSNNRCALVAVMHVNNEIGIIQDIEDLGELTKAEEVPFFCDCVQSFGRIPLPDHVDLIAVSAHKIYGPKGIGALWVRDGIPVFPLIFGGGQEAGLRSGTLSPALCVGFGEAAKLALNQMYDDHAHVSNLAQIAGALFSDWTINGSTIRRYPGNLNIRRDGLDVGRLISEVRDVAFSAGSACASGSGRPSHVLAALGLSSEQIKSSIRLGFGRYTTEEEIREAGRLINAAAKAQLA